MRVRDSKAHLANTFQGGSCCVCQELTQLHGNFSVICLMKVANGSLRWICWSLTRNLLKQLINSHHTFGFKMPPLCPALGVPRLVWAASCLRAGPCDTATGHEALTAQLQQPSGDLRQQNRLRRWGQRGWESDQQSQLPKASEIRTQKLSTFSFAAQVYISWKVLLIYQMEHRNWEDAKSTVRPGMQREASPASAIHGYHSGERETTA